MRREDAKPPPKREGYWDHPGLSAAARLQAVRWLERPLRHRSLIAHLSIFLVLLVVWRLPVINPFKLLVVVLHELSHVAVAYATGGVVFGIAIDPGAAGVTIGIGGHTPSIVAAGYVGSLAAGVLLCVTTAVWRSNEIWGLLLVVVCLSLVFGWLNDFTAVFGYGAIICLGAGAFLLRERTKKFILNIVGTACCLYPILDVSGEFFGGETGGFQIAGKTATSDVAQLATLTGIPEGMLSFVCIVVGLTTVVFLIAWVTRKDASIQVKRSLLEWRAAKALTDRLHCPDPNNFSTLRRYKIE